MNTNPPNEETILEQALSFAAPEVRQAFLHGACGGNEALRARVQALIEAHEAAGGFLAEMATEGVPTFPIELQLDERPCTVIGGARQRRTGDGKSFIRLDESCWFVTVRERFVTASQRPVTSRFQHSRFSAKMAAKID